MRTLIVAVRVALAVSALSGAMFAAGGMVRAQGPTLTPRWGEQPLRTDQMGWLRRNPQPRENPAPYVLTDKGGALRYFVTPKSGMDLEPFLGRQVAMRGEAFQQSRRFVAETALPLDKTGPKSEVSRLGGTLPAGPAMARTMPRGATASRPTADPGVRQAAFQDEPDPAVPGDHSLLRPVPEGDPEPIEPGRVVAPEAAPQEMDYLVEDHGSYADVDLYASEWGDSVTLGPSAGEHFWARFEYLMWWVQGMDSPPLVTTSPAGTPRAEAGVLGFPGTTILYGGQEISDEALSGGRIRTGMWLDDCRNYGIEADYWMLDQSDVVYRAGSNGTPILARPFYDVVNGRETSELVAFPAELAGTVTVTTPTEVQGGGFRFLWNACCSQQCDPCADPCGFNVSSRRVDWLVGYRAMKLNEALMVREDLVSLNAQNPGSFVVRDYFGTENEFSGFDVGVMWQVRENLWSLDFTSRIAIGNNHQTVTIMGGTDTTQNGVTTPQLGGLLAQRTNIGTYTRDELSAIPELGVTLGYQITPCLRLVAGYNFIYWANVVRPGDQINTDINPNLLPPENPIQTADLRPNFAFHGSDVWIQGVNFGVDYRF